MAFWGVEVSSSKPYSHKFDPSRGRLRISQATLGGGGDHASTVTVQCSVGYKSPVFLCNLIPEVSETCHLELEFEEDEEVIFSVRGVRSVYLTGYYLGHRPSLHGDDSESYGEDIAESDASDTYSDRSEDEYESDFIDDADVAIYTNSHGPKSSVVIEEIEDDEKQHHNHHRLKKKHQFSDSDDETVSKQLAVRNKESKKGESEDEDGFPICFNVGDKASRKKKIRDDQKRKFDETSQNIVSISEANIAPDSTLASETVSKNNENSKKRKEKDEKSSLRSKSDDKQESETNANLSINGIEEHAEESLNVVKDTQNDGNPDICKQSKKKPKKRKVREEGLSVEKESSIAPKKEEEMPVDNTAITDANAVTKEQKKEKKKKKDKKKNGDSNVIKQEASAKEKAEVVNGGGDESQHGSQAKKTRTFPNGLIVEEISMGKPDGKKAAPGKKVSVRYIGKLKNGTIFDSNIGQRPFKFRLGIGEVIKGWDIGVNGMCVGDKRRLTVPPSFGYGAKGVGKIPPNSWLVFDVELVDVY